MKHVRLTVSVWVRVEDDVVLEDLSIAGNVSVWNPNSGDGGEAITAVMVETDDAEEVDEDSVE